MMDKDIRPGMIVRYNRHSVWYDVQTWLLVTAVHHRTTVMMNHIYTVWGWLIRPPVPCCKAIIA